MLRCLADTAITFCYLSKCASPEEFKQFREYGEGQEKLLMLHLQDSYVHEASLEGRTASAISKELGSFTPELIQIEPRELVKTGQPHWLKKRDWNALIG